jgi:hypothetical protein
VQTLVQLLPPAEMGTAQQENPVAQFKATSFEVSLTCEEARILAQGLEALRREYDEIAYSDDPYTLGKLRENFNQFLP